MLMLHRTKKKNDENAGKWVGIGGKFEAGESPEECLLREVREETGINLESYLFRGLVTFVSDVWGTEFMCLYTATVENEAVCACAEGDLCWVDKEKLLELPMWEGDRIFFDLIQRDTPFFSLKLAYSGDALTSASLNGKPISIR